VSHRWNAIILYATGAAAGSRDKFASFEGGAGIAAFALHEICAAFAPCLFLGTRVLFIWRSICASNGPVRPKLSAFFAAVPMHLRVVAHSRVNLNFTATSCRGHFALIPSASKGFLVGLELGLSPSPFWAFFAAAIRHVFPIACLFQHIFVFAAAERRRVAHFHSEFFLAGFELGRLFFDLFFTCNSSLAKRTAAARLAAIPYHPRFTTFAPFFLIFA
jgi:hypothetical protein